MKKFDIQKLFRKYKSDFTEDDFRAPVGLHTRADGKVRAVEAATYKLGETKKEIEQSIKLMCAINPKQKFKFYVLNKKLNYDKLKKHYKEGEAYPPDGLNVYQAMKECESLLSIRGAFVDD